MQVADSRYIGIWKESDTSRGMIRMPTYAVVGSVSSDWVKV